MKAGMNPEVSFGIIADCQYRDADNEVGVIRDSGQPFYNNYRESIPKLHEAVKIFNRHQLDFVVHLGDFVDRDLDDADKLHEITNGLNVDLLHVIGNHELWVPGTKVEHVVEKYRMPSQYYSKRLNGTRFIMLDTCDLGVLEHKPDSPKWKIGRALLNKMQREQAINAYHWNGGLGEEQLQWLNDELTDAAKNGEDAILFAHHPVFPPGILNALNSNEIMETIDAHENVTAFINGHNHGGAFGVRKGIPYITMPGMLSGPHNAFGVANLYHDRLEIQGYGRVHNTVIERTH